MKMLIGRAPAALIAVLLLLDGFVLLAHLQAPTIERTIGPADIVSREGHAYIVALREDVGWLYELPTDGPDVEASTLQILHGGQPIGPAHAPHDHIRKVGNGAYSHWRGTLYVSFPGNAEPSPIVLKAETRLARWLRYVGGIATALVVAACSIALLPRVMPHLKGRWRPALLAAALVFDAALVLLHLAAPTFERTIGAADVVAREGHAYVVQLRTSGIRWPYVLPSDGPGGSRSELRLFHEGQELGPAHALHETIRKVGNGAYSHWGNELYVSLPSNQGLTSVTMRASAHLPLWLIGLAAIATLVGLGAYCTVWQPALFATPEAQASFCRRAGLIVSCGFLCAFVAAWWTTSPLVVFEIDTAGYLRPALLTAQGEWQSGARTLGYPFFLAMIMFFKGSLAHVPTIQIFLLIGTVLAAIGVLHASAPAKAVSNLGLPCLHALVATVTTGMLLAYQPLTNYVHRLIPEALYAFLAVFNLLIIVVACRKLSKAALLGVYFIGTLTSTFTYYVKPHWGGALVFTWIALTARLFLAADGRAKLSLPIAASAPVVAAAIALFALYLPQRSFHEKAPEGMLFGPLTLVCANANLVEPVVHQAAIPRDLAEHIARTLRETLEVNPGTFLRLGFDPDYCFYRSSIQHDLDTYFQNDARSQRVLLVRLFLAGVENKPSLYVSRIVDQISYALSHPFPNPLNRGYPTAEGYESMVAEPAVKSLPPEWVNGKEPRPLQIVFPAGEQLATYLLDLADRHGAVIWLAILAAAGAAAARAYRRSWRKGTPVLAAGLAVGLYMSSTAVVALAHSFDIDRYREALAPLALVTMAVCILRIAEAFLAFGRRQ